MRLRQSVSWRGCKHATPRIQNRRRPTRCQLDSPVHMTSRRPCAVSIPSTAATPSWHVPWLISCCCLLQNPLLMSSTCIPRLRHEISRLGPIASLATCYGSLCPLILFIYSRYTLDRRLGGPQNRSGRRGEQTILDPTGTRTPTPRSSSP
jgi:hypothetical protein